VPRYVISPRAQADIEEIWDYTAARWDIDQAERYIRAIRGAIEMVADDPQLGRRCDDIRVGYRKFPIGSHVLFYRFGRAGLDVVRILHQRMDFARHLSE
jgi:toxin ParE1/3/4